MAFQIRVKTMWSLVGWLVWHKLESLKFVLCNTNMQVISDNYTNDQHQYTNTEKQIGIIALLQNEAKQVPAAKFLQASFDEILTCSLQLPRSAEPDCRPYTRPPR